MRRLATLTLISAAILTGCATISRPPVEVIYAQPANLPPSAAIAVVPEPGEVDWSAEQALRSTGQTISNGAPWRLRTAERTVVRANSSYDPFCDRWSGPFSPYYGRYWGHYWNRDPWCQDRVSIRTTRMVFWALEDAEGRVVWQAQSREPQSTNPPSLASIRLASELAAWRGVPILPPEQ